MIEQLSFYLKHSLNDLRVNGRRTFFALLCIAAGVAAIVSLQTLAVMVSDTLSTNLQASNRGDMKVQLASFGSDNSANEPLQQAVTEGTLIEERIGFLGQGADTYYLSEAGLAKIRDWLATNQPGADLTYPYVVADMLGTFLGTGTGTAATIPASGASATSLTPVLIDPNVYPFYAEVKSQDGKLLRDLLAAPTDIVLDEKAALALKANLGDVVRVNGADADFTLRGIVPTAAEITDPFTGFLAGQFGFYYLRQDAISLFSGVTPRTDRLYIRLADSSVLPALNRAFTTTFPYFTVTTTDDLRKQNEALSSLISQFVSVMGLISLLIGSIGIINTMQVIVRRRTLEVAVLKTIGLQARQVTILFLVEALIMGVVGSLAGIVLGWATTFLTKGVAESLVGQTLLFRITPGPAINGFIVGVLVTVIFGFLPTLSAGQVRPALVLRPADSVIPRAGRLLTLLSLLGIILALSFVAQTILGSFNTAFAVVAGAFLGAGFLYLALNFLIWLFGRLFPSFGVVDLKVAMRQMLVSRGRAAITLLALVVGVFSLSTITLFADSINRLMNIALTANGNVMITAQNEATLARVESLLAGFEGVERFRVARTYQGEFVSLQRASGEVLDFEAVKALFEAEARRTQELAAQFGGGDQLRNIDIAAENVRQLAQLGTYDLDRLPQNDTYSAGRPLNAEDAGKLRVVVRESGDIRTAGIRVGDKLTMEFDERTLTFEVVGTTSGMNLAATGLGTWPIYTLSSELAGIAPSTTLVLVDIPAERIPDLRRALAAVPGTFALELDALNKLITSLLGTFQAFPTLVALLGLIVGGVVIANSVALSTMERRREIAVMKSVGLQRERVLLMLLFENGILGLIGGLIGVGIGFVVLSLLLAATGAGSAIPVGAGLLLMVVCIGVALVAALTTAWGAAGEKPLTVLRYE